MMKTITCCLSILLLSSFCLQEDPKTILAKKHLNQGYEYLETANHDSSIYFFRKSADIYFERQNWQKYAESLNNISVNHQKLGKYDSAIAYAERALTVCKDKISPTNLEASYSFNTLGITYRLMGNFTLALEYFEQSKDIKIKNLGKNHIEVTKAYNNMAIAHTMNGEFDKSIAYFRKALDIRKRTLSPDHRLLTNMYNNIGATYWEQRQYDSALFYHNKTLEIRKKTLGNHPLTGNSLNNIGAVHEMQEDYDLALDYYQQALVVFHDVFGKRHPLINSTTLNIGDVYDKSNQLDKALQYYQKAIISVSGNFNEPSPIENPSIDSAPNHFDLVSPLSSKASVFEKKYDQLKDPQFLQYALNTIQKCDSTIFLIRQQQQEDLDKLALGAQVKTTYETGIRICLKLYELSNDRQYAELMFYFAEQSKSSVLLQATSTLTAKNFGGIPSALLEKEKELKEAQDLIKSQMLTDSSAILKTRLFQIKRKYDSLTTVFEQQFPNYYELRYNTKIVSVNNVQSDVLEQNQLLIEYFINDKNLYLFAIGKKDFKVFNMPADSNFYLHYKQFIEGIKKPASVNQGLEQFKSYTESAFHLYETLLAPLEKFIQNRELIIVPDGILALIPMDALLTKPVTSKRVNYQSLPYLLKSHTISYANSSTTLWNNVKAHTIPDEAINIIAFAPSFSEKELVKPANNNRFTSLNWNDDEINMLGKYFKTETYSEALATESTFKEKADQFRIIHIASHALIDDENPMNSKIAFTDKPNDKQNDGLLHTFELYNSQINAEMVVLSACNTGVGTIQKGENVMSLGYAFAYAGVPNTLMSHWQIDDKSTYLLMQRFYKNLSEGMTKSKALQNAKLSLLKGPEITYANPYYWGAFVLFGDTYPVVKRVTYSSFIYIGVALLFLIIVFSIQKILKK